MLEGVVKWFDTKKGYGFIARDEGADVFVHYSSIQSTGLRTLNQDDKVAFEIVDGEKGPRAENVTVASTTN